jgi:2'-hydroxyisoflavone reductase
VKVLVLGGTQFVGRAIVHELLACNHEVSLFHRGKTGPDLFPNCQHILGDRTEDIEKVCDSEWDAVIDVSGYLPSQAKAATKIKTKHYTFVSTISVYDMEGLEGPLNEATRMHSPQEGDEVTPANYGPLKVRFEEILVEAFGDRLTVIRPGIIFGPHDPTGRFPYWVTRLDGCDNLLVPDQLDQPIQWIDSRDLASFAVSLTERKEVKIVNAVGGRVSFGEMLDEIRGLLNHGHHFVMASLQELEKANVKLWIDLPLIYKSDDRWVTFNFDPKRALELGLTLRPLVETCRDTLDWARNAPKEARGKYGMDRDRELEAMDAIRAS